MPNNTHTNYNPQNGNQPNYAQNGQPYSGSQLNNPNNTQQDNQQYMRQLYDQKFNQGAPNNKQSIPQNNIPQNNMPQNNMPQNNMPQNNIPSPKARKPLYLQSWFLVIVGIGIFAIFAIRCSRKNEVNSSQTVVSETEKVATETDTKEPETTAEDSKEALKEDLKEKESLVWFGDVRNDVTGKWRCSMYSEGDSQETFAAEYYKAFFESDDEIHAVINATFKTTARLTVSTLDNNLIYVSILEYVDGEEHDAKLLFSGMPLKSYIVHLDTGEIEDVSTTTSDTMADEGEGIEKPEYQTIFEDIMSGYDYAELNIFETPDHSIKLDFMSNEIVSNETEFVRKNIQNYINYCKALYAAYDEYPYVYYTAFVTMPDGKKINALNIKMTKEKFEGSDWYSLGNEEFYKQFVDSCEGNYDLSPVFSKYINETEIFP